MKGCFWSNQWGEFLDSWNYPPEAMNPIVTCFPRYWQAAFAEANTYSSSYYTGIELLSTCWKLLPNPTICIKIPMNFLVCRLPLAGCTADFIFLILFSAPIAAFLTKRSLLFTWWLVSIGDLGGTFIYYDINNYLTQGLKLFKRLRRCPMGIRRPVGVHQLWRETGYKTHFPTD